MFFRLRNFYLKKLDFQSTFSNLVKVFYLKEHKILLAYSIPSNITFLESLLFNLRNLYQIQKIINILNVFKIKHKIS